ncbi:MAG: phosphopentomutase, partial [Spirochaetaceae bacterium]|nr:phosphopentomutase [Spirochaetaceae bacterium]
MRSLILLIDSFGVGELPDAQAYGDQGANTLLHICQNIKGSKWPTLTKLGLGNMGGILGYISSGLEPTSQALASYGVMAEKSPGKDTTTGHWELMGIELDKAFYHFDMDYPSFPESFLEEFIRLTGCKGILGNKAASGTAIIEELGSEHEKTSYPICYTSADSVFQIAAHSDIIPLETLYEYCKIARKLCDSLGVGRVIARPFEGQAGDYHRTEDRKDFSLPLPG